MSQEFPLQTSESSLGNRIKEKKRFEKILSSQKIFYENSREDTICDQGGTANLQYF